MEKFSIVITSGGIGSTHDDVTFEGISLNNYFSGIAKALGEETLVNQDLLNVIQRLSNPDTMFQSMEAKIKLATVPSSSELIYGPDHATGRETIYPIIRARNIYILPGIPHLFKTAFEIIKVYLYLNNHIYKYDSMGPKVNPDLQTM